MPTMRLLQRQIIIITGSASGIGLAAVHGALREGARVLGVDISPQAAVFQDNPNFHSVQTDLTDRSAALDIVRACVDAYGGRIDGLFNVAGVMDSLGSVDTLTDSAWEKCIAVNLTAPVRLMREVIPFMIRQRSGSIVNVSSKGGSSGAAAGVAYTSSKHGLIGASRNVAWRFRHENIRCNVVSPGGVATGIITDRSEPKHTDMAAFEAMRPILTAHLGESMSSFPITSENVADAMIFLASSRSAAINGAVLPVDNAWSTV